MFWVLNTHATPHKLIIIANEERSSSTAENALSMHKHT